MAITDISDTDVNQRVSVIAKVVSASSKEITKEDKTLLIQNCQIADAYGRCRIILWQKHMIQDESYKISNVLSILVLIMAPNIFLLGYATFDQVTNIGDVTDEVYDEDRLCDLKEK